MTTRSNLLGSLGLIALLGGCFEDPIEDPTTSESTGGTTEATTAPTTTTASTTTTPTPTTDPTSGSTTDDSTTVGPLDTTLDGTTTMVEGTESSGTTSTADPCDAACDGLVCGPVGEECNCGMCMGMAVCAEDQTYCGIRIGYANPFPDTVMIPGQLQIGFRFQVFEPTTVRRLGMIAGGAGTDVRLALYDHDGMGPANRLAQTGAVTLYAVGENEFDVGATPIMPGDYWVMLHTSASLLIRRSLNGDNGYEEALRSGIPFVDGFPVTMDDEMVITDYRYNLYMVVED